MITESKIKDFPYIITNNGEVISIKRESVLKPVRKSNGYLGVTLCNSGVRKQFEIHRLVATYFIDNPMNKKTVNHIDGNTHNNNINNLEWATHSENHKHAYDVLGRKSPQTGRLNDKNGRSKSVSQFTLDGVFIKSYPSAREASRQNSNFTPNLISYACSGKYKTHAGFKWEYSS